MFFSSVFGIFLLMGKSAVVSLLVRSIVLTFLIVWIKIISTVFLVIAIILFWNQSQNVCMEPKLYPIDDYPLVAGLSALTQLVFLLIFRWGWTRSWIKADIWFNLVAGLLSITGSVLAAMEQIECKIPEHLDDNMIWLIMASLGGFLQIIGSISLVLLYQYVEC